jgi:membrane-associated phospholipid phosphatase
VGAAAALLPELLKLAVARPRPALWPWLLPTSGYSFPSGHAVAGTALYAARWLGGPRPLTVLSSLPTPSSR